jgi:hypothetical protein
MEGCLLTITTLDDNSMKCLSLRQPYVELLVSGRKTIELRKWNTNFRGEFLIHTSKNVNKEKCKSLGIEHTKLTDGSITGRAILYDVRGYDNKAQFMKDKSRHSVDTNIFNSYMYGFMIRNAHRLKYPVPYSGRLGFFEVDQSILKASKSFIDSSGSNYRSCSLSRGCRTTTYDKGYMLP